jgi:hypothetical protein
MAAATTIIMAGAAAVSIGKSIHDANKANKAEKQAKKNIVNYDRQSLTNVYAGTSVPMAGYELERQEMQRSQAEMSNMLAQGGAQSAIGGASQISMMGTRAMQDLSARLEAATMTLSQLKAQDEANIRGMTENREQQDLAGLGAELSYNRSKQDEAVSRGIDTMASVAEISMDTQWGDKKMWSNGLSENKVNRQSERIANRFERESRNNIM